MAYQLGDIVMDTDKQAIMVAPGYYFVASVVFGKRDDASSEDDANLQSDVSQ